MSSCLQQDKVVCFEIHLFSALFNKSYIQEDYLPEIIHLIEISHEIVTLLEAFILLEDKPHS